MHGNDGRESFVELEKQFNAMQAKLKRTKNMVDKHITKVLTEKWLLECERFAKDIDHIISPDEPRNSKPNADH